MENYLKVAQEIATESAEIALKYFGFNTERTWKSDNTPLTIADTTINSLVIKKIKEHFPNHSVRGEEESLQTKNSRYTWVCDPIDGTMPYSLGMPTFTFLLALVDETDGQPILGLVNDPILKNMYWATKGGGAFRNGKPIHVNTDATLHNSYMMVDGSGRQNGYVKTEIMETLRAKGAKVMGLLSFGYGAIQIANGKVGGAIFLNNYAHDVAAVKIITEEAGGKSTDLAGKGRRYDEDGFGMVVSNGLLHEELLAALKKL